MFHLARDEHYTTDILPLRRIRMPFTSTSDEPRWRNDAVPEAAGLLYLGRVTDADTAGTSFAFHERYAALSSCPCLKGNCILSASSVHRLHSTCWSTGLLSRRLHFVYTRYFSQCTQIAVTPAKTPVGGGALCYLCTLAQPIASHADGFLSGFARETPPRAMHSGPEGLRPGLVVGAMRNFSFVEPRAMRKTRSEPHFSGLACGIVHFELVWAATDPRRTLGFRVRVTRMPTKEDSPNAVFQNRTLATATRAAKQVGQCDESKGLRFTCP